MGTIQKILNTRHAKRYTHVCAPSVLTAEPLIPTASASCHRAARVANVFRSAYRAVLSTGCAQLPNRRLFSALWLYCCWAGLPIRHTKIISASPNGRISAQPMALRLHPIIIFQPRISFIDCLQLVFCCFQLGGTGASAAHQVGVVAFGKAAVAAFHLGPHHTLA